MSFDALDSKVSYFIRCARASSFREASASIGVTQAALSVAIRKLEDQLGARLFERSASGIRLTERGEAVLQIFEHHRRLMQRGLDEALERTHRIALRVGAVPHVGLYELLPVLERHRSALPPIQLAFAFSLHLLESLRGGELDFAFVTWTRKPKHVESVPMRLDPKSVVGLKSKFAHIRRATTRAELREEPQILQPMPQFDFTSLIPRDQSGYIVRDMHAHRELILRGCGIGDVQLTVFTPSERKRLVIARVPAEHPTLRLYAAYREELGDEARAHLGFLVAQMMGRRFGRAHPGANGTTT